MGQGHSIEYEGFGKTREDAIKAFELMLTYHFSGVLHKKKDGSMYVRDTKKRGYYLRIEEVTKDGETFFRAYIRM